MTDKEKLLALLDEFGVGYNMEDNDIVCVEGHGKVKGYSGFYTRFSFSSRGEFIDMGVWE